MVGTVIFSIPKISEDDLFAFHETHFSQAAVTSFNGSFIKPPQAQQPEEEVTHQQCEDDDNLGHYEDGVKRTLTDEQIEIFRHSELEALRKESEKRAETASKAAAASDETNNLGDDQATPSGSGTPSSTVASPSRVSKKKNKKNAKRARTEPKPDLRKRTWDVVEKGLDSLEYD